MKSISKRFKYAFLAPLFIVATLVMEFAHVPLVSAATVTWDGEGSDTKFSTAANWVGDAVPQENDVLSFPSGSGDDVSLVNDLGINFGNVTFNGGSGAAGTYTLDTLTLIDDAVLTVSGTDTSVTVGTVNGATDLTVNGGGHLSITTLAVGGNLTSSSAFTGTTVTVTGDATFDTAAPTITTLSANDLTANVALSVTDLTLTGDYLVASSGSLEVTGTFSATGDYTVGKAFTAGTFSVAGNLVVNVLPTVTTLTVIGNLTSNDDLEVTTLNLTGDFLTDSTGTLTVDDTFTTTGDYTVSKAFTTDTFTVGGNLTVGVAFTAATVGVTGDLSSSVVFTTGTMTVGGTIVSGSTNGRFVVNGELTVDSDLVLTSPFTAGTLHVTGDFTNNNYNSDWSATNITVDGDVQMNESQSTSAKYTVGGNMTLGDWSTYNSASIYLADGSTITGNVTVDTYSTLNQNDGASLTLSKLIVKNGATVKLNGTIDFPIEFGSGKSQISPALAYNTYTSEYDSDADKWVENYSTLKFTGDITLKNNLRVLVNGDKKTGKVEFNGDIDYNGFKISKSNSSTGKLYIDGKEVKNPMVTTEFNGDKIDSSESVAENETATLNGSRGSVTVYPGGTLKGTGTAISANFRHDATLSPGNSPGTLKVLSTLTMDEDSVYYAELKSTSAYDKVQVGEEYSGSGNAVMLDNPTLTLALYEGYSMKKGDKFTIIDNKSDTDIDGTFKGLDEGDTIKLGGGTFKISYVGGDGNDVVLTVTKVPTAVVGAPNTGILRLIQANPAVSAILGLTTAALLFLIARRQLALQRR